MDFCAPDSYFSYCQNREHTSRPFQTGPNFNSRVARAKRSSVVNKRNLLGHYGCVNAIEFSSDGRIIASGGDDRRLLIWDLWKTLLEDKAPLPVETPHISNINSCCFDNVNQKVATGGNDGQVIVHDINVLKSTSVYGLSDAVYCISPDPINATILATASDEGKVQILDTRTSDDSFPVTLADTGGSMHSVMYNSAEPRILATANSKLGVAIWDIRRPLKSLSYKSNVPNCMSVRFNSRGDKLLVLRRRAPPVLYDIAHSQPIYQFDHDTYYNACTLKGGCFAGMKDEFVASGSDDFNVYLWKIPDTPDAPFTQTEPHLILKGHRSIVNQVRFSHHNQMILSSGVEKIIKAWTPYPTPDSTCGQTYSKSCEDEGDIERNAYSHEEYIHMVLRAGSFLSHDYTNGNTEEEPCMIAFFDSLIQREVEQSESERLSNSSSVDSDQERQEERLMDQTDNSQHMFGVEDDEVHRERDGALSDRRSSPSSSSVGGPDVESRGAVATSSSRSDDASRPSYLEYESSSDSGSEVDEILSAMYNRYMHSRERLENQGPTGKKISSVIAQGKYKDKKGRGHIHRQRLQHIGENLQHSDDQYLRDNARNLSILADVIDNFVDNLVASDNTSTSRNLTGASNDVLTNSVPSNSNYTHATTSSDSTNLSIEAGSSTHPRQATVSVSNPSRGQAQESNLHQPPPLPPPPAVVATLEPGRYFIPELEAFAPQSLQAVLDQEQHRTSTVTTTPSSHHSRSAMGDNGQASSLAENGLSNGRGSARISCSSPELNTRSEDVVSNNIIHSVDLSDVHTNGAANYANRKLSKMQSRTGKNHSSKYSCPKSSLSPSSVDTSLSPLSSPSTSSAGSSSCTLTTAASSSSSSSLSPLSPNSAAQRISYSCTTVKPSLLSAKLKTSKAKEEVNGKQPFPVRETGALFSKECPTDSNEPVTFKKISKSKKRRFRQPRISDSCSSSEEETV